MASFKKVTTPQDASEVEKRGHTLQLKWPFGFTLLLSLFFFFVFFFGMEIFAETRAFRSFFNHQTWGGRHVAFERQLSRLDHNYYQEGKIDCIFLGNSMVWRGFDPQAFQQGYQSQTGEELRCFNFGVDGMPASNAGALARILVEDYQPKMLIYGVDARDFAVPIGSEDARVLAEMAWLKYRMGGWSPKGWFIEHSELYRYRQAIQTFINFDYQYTIRGIQDPNHYSLYGFDFDTATGDILSPPDPADSRGHIRYYFDTLQNYQIREENITGFIQVLEQEPNLETLMIVELPVPETYKYFFGNQDADYQKYIDEVTHLTDEKGITFIETSSWQVIPSDGWVDYSHLNRKGARIFSQALGVEIAQIKGRVSQK